MKTILSQNMKLLIFSNFCMTQLTLVALMSILLCNAYSKCSINDGNYNHLVIITFEKKGLKVNVS